MKIQKIHKNPKNIRKTAEIPENLSKIRSENPKNIQNFTWISKLYFLKIYNFTRNLKLYSKPEPETQKNIQNIKNIPNHPYLPNIYNNFWVFRISNQAEPVFSGRFRFGSSGPGKMPMSTFGVWFTAISTGLDVTKALRATPMVLPTIGILSYIIMVFFQ